MISHTTLSPLLENWEIEHHGVLQTLRELVDRSFPLDDPLIAAVLAHSDLVNFAFWSEEASFIESATQVVRGRQTYDKIIRDGFWNRAWTWLDDFNLESEHTSTPGRRLRVAEIHAPHVKGCIGTFATSKSGAIDISIKAFGLGYQKVKRVAVTNSYEQPHACGALTTGVQFVVHVWKHRSSEKRRALVQFIAIDGALAGEPLSTSESHQCASGYRKLAARAHAIASIRGWKVGQDYSDVPMHSAAAGATSTHKLELEKGSVYSASLELPIAWFAQPGQNPSTLPELSIGIETRVAKTIEMSWKLVSGHDYMRFRAVPGDMRMFWVWD
jgi:hypothetical protein